MIHRTYRLLGEVVMTLQTNLLQDNALGLAANLTKAPHPLGQTNIQGELRRDIAEVRTEKYIL